MKKYFRYHELSEKAKKEAYERFAWDFRNNKLLDVPEETILSWLDQHWFDVSGGTILSRITEEESNDSTIVI